MTQYKNRFKFYAAWEYDKEEEALNNYSQKGWQLEHGGSFFSTFIKEEDYRIYTDKESLKEMQNRWIRIANILSAFYIIFLLPYVVNFISTKETIWIMHTLLYTLMFVTFRLGIRTLKLKLEGKKSKINIPIQFLFICILFAIAALFILK